MPDLPQKKISAHNYFMVSLSPSDTIVVMKRLEPMSKDDALNLAAYLVALADDDGVFPELLERVKNA